MKFARTAVIVLIGMSAGAPAWAGLCDLKVYDSANGVKAAEADMVFAPNDQFVICFRPTADGFVTLWDRMPTSGSVERLAPNAISAVEGRDAVAVTAEQITCFGAHEDADYNLHMDPADGDGLGRMWLVFTETAETHPNMDSFSSTEQFADSYRRFGAGMIDVESTEAEENDAACEPKPTLAYSYVVR